MSKISVKRIDATFYDSGDPQPYAYQVMQDNITLGRFTVDEHENAEAAKAAADACAERYAKDPWVSPFLRHRAVLLDDYGTAQKLASLCLNLWNGTAFKVDIGSLLAGADSKHKAIAFELMQSYAQIGENDEYFMAICDDIRLSRRANIAE